MSIISDRDIRMEYWTEGESLPYDLAKEIVDSQKSGLNESQYILQFRVKELKEAIANLFKRKKK